MSKTIIEPMIHANEQEARIRYSSELFLLLISFTCRLGKDSKTKTEYNNSPKIPNEICHGTNRKSGSFLVTISSHILKKALLGAIRGTTQN